MRIAWLGDIGSDGGVPQLGSVFLKHLIQTPTQLDWFTSTDSDHDHDIAWRQNASNFRCFRCPYSWNWESWYGRRPRIAFVVSFLKRILSNRRLARLVVQQHRQRPYDAVIQFSQGELLSLRPFAEELPIILYPQVHAAGELRWCQNEEHLAQQCEPGWWRKFRLLYLKYRSSLQQRDYNLAKGILGVSHQFNELVSSDYGVPKDRFGVVYHPVEVNPSIENGSRQNNHVRLLFVGRISVRKGIDTLVESIPRLLSEDEHLDFRLIGSGALWSNYEPLLKALPTTRCEWMRSAKNQVVLESMQQSDILLMPSAYEPGGIVVAEALASGLVLAASNEVGAAEGLVPPVRWPFPARNPDAFCDAVRSAVAAVRNEGRSLRKLAQETGNNRFSAPMVAQQLLSTVARLTCRSNAN